ncbi:MAG TPA: hybrid sensor histidine kinase/response regulator, partial [Nannocystis sp.]
VADDNADMRNYLARILSAYWTVEAVCDGAQALAAVRERRPDLVLSDVMMPEIVGLQLVAALRADPAVATIPVLLLSARAGEAATIEGLESGADAYLIKPFAANELVARVRAQLASARARQEAARVQRDHVETTERLLAQARDATRARDEMLAVVSHDLRNPLAVIGTSVDLLARSLGDDERAPRLRRSVDTIRRAVGGMSRLIADLLDSASIDAGSLSLDPAPHTVDALLRELWEMFESQAAGKGVAFSVEVAAGVPALVCDRQRILQALGNLVANALKFTAPPGSVLVRATAERDGGAVRFRVIDDGPGIAEDLRLHLFDRHWLAQRHSSDGHGLGLSIAKGIVEKHGGQIDVDSTPGRGTTFSLALPVTPGALSVATATPATPALAETRPGRPEDTFLRGGGEMGARTRAFDWSTTSLGAAEAWPQSLRTTVSTMLRSPYPITMFWGPELVMLNNDAFAPIHGAKHPAVLGMPAPTALAEAWGQLGPLVEGVLASGESLFIEDAAVVFERGVGGVKEEAYFTWCYVPTADETGGIAGLFAISSETTRQVVGGRRLTVLRELSIRTALDKTVDAVFRSVEDVLAQAGADLPFALLYTVEGDAARLVACVGVERGTAAASASPALDEPWPLGEVAHA